MPGTNPRSLDYSMASSFASPPGDAIACATPFTLALGAARGSQFGDGGIPLATGGACRGEDVGRGVPAGMGAQIFDDGVDWAGAILGAGFGDFEVFALVGGNGIEVERGLRKVGASATVFGSRGAGCGVAVQPLRDFFLVSLRIQLRQ